MHLTVETGNVTVIDIGLVGWHSCVNKIFECIMLMSAACPRKKTVDGTYVNLNKTKLNAAFDPLWESIKVIRDSGRPHKEHH